MAEQRSVQKQPIESPQSPSLCFPGGGTLTSDADRVIALNVPVQSLLHMMSSAEDDALSAYARATLAAIQQGLVLVESCDALVRDLFERHLAGVSYGGGVAPRPFSDRVA